MSPRRVVFAHGLWLHASSWQPWIELLEQAGFAPIAPGWPGIADTVNFDHIKRHYYMTHIEINPTRIVPIGPAIDLTKPHKREKIS